MQGLQAKSGKKNFCVLYAFQEKKWLRIEIFTGNGFFSV